MNVNNIDNLNNVACIVSKRVPDHLLDVFWLWGFSNYGSVDEIYGP